MASKTSNIKMLSTKVTQLEGLEKNIIPLVPLERTFSIIIGNQKKMVVRTQLPLTVAYAFTNYRSQGQTICHAIIDIGTSPSGSLTPFNIYVALSRCRGRENIQLLQEFDEKLLMNHPSEYLCIKDERLKNLESDTESWWNTTQT
ncbi:hypothetical protein PAXINDRAFT_157720 [Paxillus involutus ATCC 200175]|uniref:DNA helicase n=1 Tax=Paxillus involutus ATCC 200175 TaxID=664439 RepID=A0A0C9T358_PAXIN|nr:hypothetical protein PAXINDRAFT_157720 [Paxillus involutus ATCC 200175]